MPQPVACRFRSRARRRGAALVESLIVISALTLGLSGLIYFRDLYLRQLSAMRLARGAALAHALAGCKDNSPASWIGRDLADYRASVAGADRQSARGSGSSKPLAGGDGGRAARLFGGSGSATSDGEGLLNPISDADVSGTARVRGQRAGRAATLFQGQARSRSYVSCGEEVKDGDFDQLLPVIRDEAAALFGMR
jgi:hypothetical protein